MTRMNTQDANSMAMAILTAHLPRFGAHPPVVPQHYASDDPIYRGVRQAAALMGFIEADAECLARAWQAQSRRLGLFEAQRWPATPVDFDLREFPPQARDDAFAPCPEQLGLYAVLPDAAWVGRMARAGVPTVQLRFKSGDARAVQAEVRAAVAAVQSTPALLFINDHWQAAIEAGAYGVHLGQEDLDALTEADVDAIRSAGLRLGVSTHGYAEMQRADAVSPSYLALGAVFPTTLKQMATAPQGLTRLKCYAQLMRGYPLVAIGGFDVSRVPAAMAAGVGSVAVVRAIVGADAPEAAARALMDAIAQHPPAAGR
ncbi:MAG TPA: thiamine phosphate synthase [Burkholderiaceae bacterium]|nr:thiamine phosphate synthase [Burkholderiaceae bacterium]